MKHFKRLSLLVSLITVLLVSCSQEEEVPSDGYEGDPVTINVIMGATDGDETTLLNRSTDSSPDIERYVNTVRDSLSGLYVETTIERIAVEQKAATRANLNNNSIFRMLVYRNDGTLAHTCDYNVNGTTATLASGSTVPALIPGTYKFVCVTKNDFVSRPLGSTEIVVNSGEDFGTYVESKTVSANNNTVTINFKRQIAQFAVEAVGSGFKNNTPVMSANSITVNNLNASGTWIADNSATKNTELSINTTNVSKQTSNGETFFVIPMNSKNLTVSISSLQFDGKTYSNINVPMDGITVARKGNYKLSIKFKKNTSGGIEYNGLIWAPGNLKYENGVYSFMESQEANTLLPREVTPHVDWFKAADAKITDLCSNVAPKGTWRLPTVAEMKESTKILSDGPLNGVRGSYLGESRDVFMPSVLDTYHGDQGAGTFSPSFYFLAGKPVNYPDCASLLFLRAKYQYDPEDTGEVWMAMAPFTYYKTLFIRCVKGARKEYSKAINVSPATINVGSGEAEISFTVTTDDGFYCHSSYEWLELQFAHINWDIMKCKVTANTSGRTRTGTIVISTTTTTKEITITQKGI